MQELTMSQMSRTDGGSAFRRRFLAGFLCGAGIAAALAITPTTSVVTRWTIYSGTIAACGNAFFV